MVFGTKMVYNKFVLMKRKSSSSYSSELGKAIEPSTLSDEDLVVFVREKDKEAYELIIDRYKRKIWGYVYRLINDKDETDDLTQQAFINAYVNIRGFDQKKKFSSWLYRIAHNLSVNWLKKKKAKVSIDRDEEIKNTLISDLNASDQAINNEISDKIIEALNRLPEKFKEPFILKYFEEKGYDEISDILRMPKNTVGTMINRAKKILKEELEKSYGPRN